MEKQLNVLLWNWGSGNYKKWMETEMQPMLEKWRAVILRWCLYYHLNSHSSFSINYHAGILNHRHIRMFNIYIYIYLYIYILLSRIQKENYFLGVLWKMKTIFSKSMVSRQLLCCLLSSTHSFHCLKKEEKTFHKNNINLQNKLNVRREWFYALEQTRTHDILV